MVIAVRGVSLEASCWWRWPWRRVRLREGGAEGAAMEMYHGRRGKDSVCGISRTNQTLYLMLAMVATMACVILWEAPPFIGAGILRRSPLLKSGTLYHLHLRRQLVSTNTNIINPLCFIRLIVSFKAHQNQYSSDTCLIAFLG